MTSQQTGIRYQRYAFHEGVAGTLTGHFGTMDPIAIDSVSPRGPVEAAVEPFLNRKGEFDKTPGFEEAALLTAGAWLSRHYGRQPSYSIGFTNTWTGTAAQLSACEPSVTARPGTYEITRGSTLNGPGLNAWLGAPPERAATYLQWFSKVSFDVQTSLRRWLPYLLLQHSAVLNEGNLRESLWFYSATRPYLARVRGMFAWDVICPESMATVMRSGSQNLASVLPQANQYLKAAGREDLAASCEPSSLRRILAGIRRDPRALKGLIALEGKLIESALELAEKGAELSSTEQAPRNLHRYCGEWSRRLQTKLRRTMGAVSQPQLARLLLVEATASLAACQGLAYNRREWVQLRGANSQVVHLELEDRTEDDLLLAA